ncbi:MAG: GGDEF domain-containing protein [Lachnospiraceae bacterium]|nr:GGDEF domain-containing protein [Lachnospiraceae bacterium]
MKKEQREKEQINVGVLIGKVNTYHPQELVHGIYQAAKDYNANVIFMLGAQKTQDDAVFQEFGDVSQYDYQMNTVYDYAELAGVDVLIVSYGTIGVHLMENNKAKFLSKFSRIPYIVLEDLDEGNYIISDNYNGMKASVEHLIADHKYKKIAYISGPEGNVDAQQRMQAYVDAMTEHGLEMPENYIIFGDFSTGSGVVSTEALLTQYPDLEAIVCGNDEMAMGAYAACKKKGLRVGEDIAVTGYDNCQLAQSMDPPLTTVDQNGYDMGYRALKEAIRLGKGSERITLKVPAAFCKRSSCGCLERKRDRKYVGKEPQYLLEHVGDIAREAADKIVLNQESDAFFDKMCDYIRELLEFTINTYLLSSGSGDEEYDKNHLMHLVRNIIQDQYGQFISMDVLLREYGNLFHHYIWSDMEDQKKKRLFKAVTEMSEYVRSYMVEMKQKEYSDYQLKTSMSPVFERKLLEYIYDEQQMYYNCVKGLKLMGVRSAMICVTEDAVICRQDKEWISPKELSVAAYFNQDNMMSFSWQERPIVNVKQGILNLFKNKNNTNKSYMVFPLFAENCHFGILACDVNPDEALSVHVYSLMVGSVLRFMQLSMNERQVQKKLESSMRLLKEKNKVLSFISAFDELTGMLNRRGFGEKAFEFNKKNEGRNAYFVFADLDHLKEINDKYGHAEGDYAIIQCARTLNASCGKHDIVGRMGGDEFMMMVASDEEDFVSKMKQKIKDAFADLNSRSNKPYYVEASIGIKPFVCNEEFDFSSILQQSDKVMYESKKKRRATIVREENP